MALEKILIIPDTHRPYHDVKAWNLVMKAGKKFKPQHIICIGDFADFYSVSSHSKDPRRADKLLHEISDCRQGFDQLDSLGAKHKVFVEGNHEDRLRRYIQDKAPELQEFINTADLFNLKGRGWTYIPYKSDIKIGKMYATHDVGTAGRYSAFKALDIYQHCVITGHSHRMTYVVEGNAVGENKVSANFGWLGDRTKVDYMQKVNVNKNFVLGFGTGYLDTATKNVYLTPVPIVNYSVVVEGKLYRG